MPKEYSRKVRVDAQLQRELTVLIRDELTDPRVTSVTVTRVDVSPDFKHAKVLISMLGEDSRLPAAAVALNHAAGRLRHGLNSRLRLRYVPQLHFAVDEQLRQADRVSGLIRAAVREDQAHADSRGTDEPKPDSE